MYKGGSIGSIPHVYGEKSSISGKCQCIQGRTVRSAIPPVYREKLLDRSFDEWECFRSEIAGVVVDALLGMTPGYTHPEMNKAEERHQSLCRGHLNKCLDL